MGKIGLIIQREYTTRVKKKSFIVMSLIAPVLFGGIIFAPLLIANTKNEHRRIVVVDPTKNFCQGQLVSNSSVQFDYSYCGFDSTEVKNFFKDSEHVSILLIPYSTQLLQVTLISRTEPGINVISTIQMQMNRIVEKSKMIQHGIDPTMVNMVNTNINVHDRVNNEDKRPEYNIILGYVSSFLIYFFIFLYSVQVMRGVMEEKISRVVEIIISSVRPFQLMMGKVIGVGLVGLTQFLIWVMMSGAVYYGGTNYLQNQEINPANARIEQTMKNGAAQNTANSYQPSANSQNPSDAMQMFESVDEALRSTNWSLIVSFFLFYFLGGYVLYSSLFAAVGSAVDQETDTQQFMLPVTAPLILSIVVMQSIIMNPNSSIAFWFSIIPLTSPIAMMARIPFGIPYWQLLISTSLLLLAIVGSIWFAGRIYRVGLLMFGKKVTYKELGKWLFYK
jgi:ABC-2 type transport system permease protein